MSPCVLGRVDPGKALFPWDLIWSETGIRSPREQGERRKLDYLYVSASFVFSLCLVKFC